MEGTVSAKAPRCKKILRESDRRMWGWGWVSLGEQGRRWSQGTGGRQMHSLDLGWCKAIGRPVWNVKSYEPIHISRRSLDVPIAPIEAGAKHELSGLSSSPGAHTFLPSQHGGSVWSCGFQGGWKVKNHIHRTRSVLLCPGWLSPFPLSCLISGPCVLAWKYLCSFLSYQVSIMRLKYMLCTGCIILQGGENGLMSWLALKSRPELEIHLTVSCWAAGSHHHMELLPLWSLGAATS